MGDQDNAVDGSACPECGEDVCVLEDLDRKWTHRSRMMPRIGWAVLCLGLLVYWVWMGSLNTYQISAAKMAQQSSQQRWWNQASFTPSQMSWDNNHDVLYLSTQDLQDAADGDQASIEHVIQGLSKAAIHNQKPEGSFGTVDQVKFVWHEPYGSMGSSHHYRFGGTLVWISKGIMLQDIRDDESVGHDSYHWSWGESGWTFWPSIGYDKISEAENEYENGAVIESWSVNLLGVFQLISFCLVIAWIVGLGIGLTGVSAETKRKIRIVIFASLLMAAAILSLIIAERTVYRKGENSQGGTESNAFLIDDLNDIVQDQDALRSLCQDLLELVPSGQQEEMLLAQAWEILPLDQDKAVASPSYRRMYASMGNSLAWIQFQQRAFEHAEEAYKVQDLPERTMWEQFSQRGSIDLRWGPLKKQSELSFNLIGWISIGVIFWMIWASLQAIARFIFRRVQKRRVAQKQCVFCTYPLTQAGMQARYPQVES